MGDLAAFSLLNHAKTVAAELRANVVDASGFLREDFRHLSSICTRTRTPPAGAVGELCKQDKPKQKKFPQPITQSPVHCLYRVIGMKAD